MIFSEEFLTNKEAGHAFSILTGYSADTIRQNLKYSEVAALSTEKNADVLLKTVKNLLSYIEENIVPDH